MGQTDRRRGGLGAGLDLGASQRGAERRVRDPEVRQQGAEAPEPWGKTPISHPHFSSPQCYLSVCPTSGARGSAFARHLCGSPFLCRSLTLCSQCLLSTSLSASFCLPLCVSPPTFSPLGGSLRLSSSVSLESLFLSICLTFSGSALCLSFPISLSLP